MPDPRHAQGRRYSERHLLFSILATLAGATSCQKIIACKWVSDWVLEHSGAGVAGYDREARSGAGRACIEAMRARDDLSDIVNADIEELLCCRRELPAFGALLWLARSARTLVNRGYHRRIAAALPS